MSNLHEKEMFSACYSPKRTAPLFAHLLTSGSVLPLRCAPTAISTRTSIALRTLVWGFDLANKSASPVDR